MISSFYRNLVTLSLSLLSTVAVAQSPTLRQPRPAADVPRISVAQLPATRGGGVYVLFEGGLVTVGDFAEATRTGEVRNVHLIRCRVASEVIASLKTMPSLRRLSLNQCDIPNDDGAALLGNRNIVWLALDFGDGPSNDGALKAVAGLDLLNDVTLIGSKISDDGIKSLARLKKVESISIESKEVTSGGVIDISSVLINCKSITLCCPRVDDQIIPVIDAFKAPDELLLNETSVSDACIPSIEKMKQLRHLGLAGTKVSRAGAARVRASLPKSNLVYDE